MGNETELEEISKKNNSHNVFWYSALIIVLLISICINYLQYDECTKLEEEVTSLVREYVSKEDVPDDTQNEIERLRNELLECQNSLSNVQSQLSDCESYLGQCKNNVSDLESRECNNY
jgi:cell division protein FtsL